MEKTNKIVVLLVAIGACFGGVTVFVSDTPWNPPTEVVSARFAYQNGFHYGQPIVMDYFDLVEQYSVRPVNCVYTKISGGSTINEAIVAGSLDFASMGVAPAIKGIDTGIGTKIFASMGSKEHMIWTWRDDIQSIEDISSDDIINVVKPSSIEEVGLIKAFADIGRTPEDVAAVSAYLTHPDAVTAMELREIDLAFAGEPYNTIYSQMEGFHCIATDTSIWGTELPGSTFIATTAFVDEYPDIAAAVSMAWNEATSWIINNPQEASSIIGSVLGYDGDEAWELWQQSVLGWNPTAGLASVKDYSDTLYELGITTAELSEEELLYPWTRGVVGI